MLGCSAPLGVERVRPAKVLDAGQRSALTSDQLSDTSAHILMTNGLRREATERNAALLRDLAADAHDAELLLTLAEVSYLLGMRPNRPARFEHMAVAALASWTALFHHEASLSLYGPQWPLAMQLHNASLAELFHVAGELPRTQSKQTTRQVFGQPIEIDYAWHAEPWAPDTFELLKPMNRYRPHGVRHEHRQYGIGASLLADRTIPRAGSDLLRAKPPHPQYQAVGVSGVMTDVQFAADQPWPPVSFDMQMHNPGRTSTVQIAGRDVPLAANFTTPLVKTLARNEPRRHAGFGGLVAGTHWEDLAGLYMFEPFDAQRIPVVFVHGLISSSLVWAELFNDLWREPEIRKTYQFWYFMYPTGYPFAYSAAALEQELRQVRDMHDPQGKATALDRMVLVGHSMGGLMARRLATDAGEAVWNSFSVLPYEEMVLREQDRRLVERTIFFKAMPEVERVIFLATPHQGSSNANLRLGRLGSRMIRLPPEMVRSAAQMIEANAGHARTPVDPRRPVSTGIDSLSPNSAFIQAMSKLPLASGVHAHSIIGSESEGQIGEHAQHDWSGTTDGLVPYASAHLPQAESELVIPLSDHSVPLHPAAIKEVLRILRAHQASQSQPAVGAILAPDP
ncbi:esterase/lipase family protein [Phycisphaerales bacterium AB-hyl4]|uniref:Esterase/lipase family protein n=1 Tax=Natronomicrosphaera hydrolytica TaxID=3242702 RepID=A0ABV4U3N4_9BACT